MKNLTWIMDLAVLMGTFILFLYPDLAQAKFFEALAARCEILLVKIDSRQAELIETLAELDNLKPSMPASVQSQIDRLVDEGLSPSPNVDHLWLEARQLVGQIISLIAPSECPVATGERPCLGEVLSDPSRLESELDYETGDPHLRTVSFESQALKEMLRLDSLTVERLLRSLKKGFVPPQSGPGVVRLTDLHKNLVEVKIVKKSVTRLIGCFQSGHLIVKRVYHKRNEGHGRGLGVYRDLCD